VIYIWFSKTDRKVLWEQPNKPPKVRSSLAFSFEEEFSLRMPTSIIAATSRSKLEAVNPNAETLLT
jgi:hypothetical protein